MSVRLRLFGRCVKAIAYTCSGNKKQCSGFADALKALKSARDSFKKGSDGYNTLNSALNAYGKEGVAGNWLEVLMDLRKGDFFYLPNKMCVEEYETIEGVTSDPIWDGESIHLGEHYIQMLGAFICTQSGSDSVLRSLQLEGFDVDKVKLRLVPIEGPVSAQEEADLLTRMVKNSGLPQSRVILKHLEDASSLYAQGKDHPSLNESRSLIQAVIDGVSVETDAHGKHSTGVPGGTGNRIRYLKEVGFFTQDDEASYGAGWGTLSAGSHPGVPEREQARIGLILALEFSQLLLIKFVNWKTNAYRAFS